MDRFSADQLREYEDAFCMFCKYDKEQKSYLPSTGLRDMLKTIGFNPTDEQLEKITIEADADGNGRMEFHEYIDLIDKLITEEDETREGIYSLAVTKRQNNRYNVR